MVFLVFSWRWLDCVHHLCMQADVAGDHVQPAVGMSHRLACYQRKGVGISHEVQLMQ